MKRNQIVNNRVYKKLLNKWRNLYSIIIPMLSVFVYILCYHILEVKIWKSEYFSDTLTSVVTFVSIIISFFGVLLTLLISAKEKSKLIEYFLNSADKNLFVASLKQLIMNGLLTVIITAILFLKDIISEKIILFLVCFCIFSLIRFTTLTYRFTNILLMLFIKDKDSFSEKEGIKLSEIEKKEMDDRINKGI